MVFLFIQQLLPPLLSRQPLQPLQLGFLPAPLLLIVSIYNRPLIFLDLFVLGGNLKKPAKTPTKSKLIRIFSIVQY